MRFQFTAAIDDETGELGWKDSRGLGEGFNATRSGLTLAHDCLEHFRLETVADEIMAHGAMYWIRGEGGYCNHYNGRGIDAETLAGEWYSLFQAMEAGNNLEAPPRTKRLDSYVEQVIAEVIEQGAASVTKEYSYSGGLEYDSRQTLKRLAEHFAAWFRIGYRKAARRYRGIAQYQVSYTFEQLEKAFDKQKPEYEGQRIKVNISTRSAEIHIDEIEFAEYD